MITYIGFPLGLSDRERSDFVPYFSVLINYGETYGRVA
jgi:hypothetical protein